MATGLVGLGAAFPRGGIAQQPFPIADFAGYSTGTALHTDALQAGPTGPQLLNVEEAFSGASVASLGTNTLNTGNNNLPPPTAAMGMGAAPRQAGKINNELGQTVQPTLPGSDPKLPGNRSFARGSGLEVGLGNNIPAGSNPVPVNKVQVSAPPPTTDLKEVGPIKGSPLVFASLLRGQASADWNNDRCILGGPISEGLGYAADAQLLNSGAALPSGALATPLLATDTPNRSVAQSRSTTRLVAPTTSDLRPIPNAGGAGLLAETRQTLAPVTIGKGTPSEVTIEIGGEWVLQAVAGGTPGSAYVRYAPGTFPSPTTPLLRVIQPNNTNPITEILNFQDLFGPGVLPIPLIDIPIPGGSLLRITIGENPRPIGSDNANNPPGAPADPSGLWAQGAVDVARVQLLNNVAPGVSGLDLRIGHMEAQVRVPAGGILCRAPIAKDANPRAIQAGGEFTYNIDITNPFRDCTLTNVRVTDTISASQGITHTVLSSDPPANSINPPAGSDVGQRTLAWNDVGPIPPNGTRRLRVVVRASAQARSGSFTDTVVREGRCADIPLGRETVTVNVPSVNGTNPPGSTIPPNRPRPTILPPPRMRPPVILPPPARPLPILPVQPSVLRTDIVRPALPFTGSSSAPLLATAAFLLAFGGWLMMSSRRFNPTLAFATVGGTGGPTLFQATPDIGLGGGGIAAPPRPRRERRPKTDHDTSLLEELGIDLTDIDLDELFDDVSAPSAPAMPLRGHDISVAAPSLLSTAWPEIDPASLPEVPPVHGFAVDSSGIAEETSFDAARDVLAQVSLFEPPAPVPAPAPPAAPVDQNSLSLHVALHWATAPRVDEPQTWPEPLIAVEPVDDISLPATPPLLPLLFHEPAPTTVEPVVAPPLSAQPLATAVPLPDVDVSRPPAGLPNLRHAMFLGGAALAIGTIKVLKNHHQKRH